MAAPKCTDEQILLALEKHNGLRAPVAAELGLVYRALIERIARMRKRGITIPDSSYHAEIRGTSTLLGPKGEVRLQWVKEAPAEKTYDQWAEAVREAFADTKPAPRITAPPPATKKLLAVIPIGDHHAGALAWREEAGADYDIKIAERLLVSAADHLIDASPPCETCLIVNCGDFFHRDSQRAETTLNRNLLDVDTRYAAMIRAGTRMLCTFIESALVKYRKVRVVNSPGNHDGVGALWLSLALGLRYEKNPRVDIDQSPGKFVYFHHGKVLLGITHGDTAKLDRLPGIMATDRPELWGQTRHRYWLTGHIHQRKVLEFPGCMVESFRTLAANDAWATAAGYRSGRNMTALVFHEDYGEVARYTSDIAMLEP